MFTFTMLEKAFGGDGSPPVVMTDDGPIQGKFGGWRNSSLIEYHGVPFAAPPINELRFKPAQRPAPWTEVKQTVQVGNACGQLNLLGKVLIGKEDCLYMSVYVPKQCTVSNPCPVMQWIYGGAWILGNNYQLGDYDPTFLAARHGVIFVAGNYRLDTLGWLALQELEDESADGAYGNYGLTDQRAVMEWIQRNVKSFGGDPNRVTIWGQSAGGWSVCQHLVSPASNRLFSHAIIESADCDGPWMIADGRHAKAL